MCYSALHRISKLTKEALAPLQCENSPNNRQSIRHGLRHRHHLVYEVDGREGPTPERLEADECGDNACKEKIDNCGRAQVHPRDKAVGLNSAESAVERADC